MSGPVEAGYRPAYQTVAERLIELIRESGYRPGDRLPTELELAKQLGVGRGIVREAVKLLSATGLVRTRRGSGTYVGDGKPNYVPMLGALPTATDPYHVGKLFDFRLVQETASARMATEQITLPKVRQLQAALELNRSGFEQQDGERFKEGDRLFHITIGEASGNPFLAAAMTQVMDLQIWAVHVLVGRVPGSFATALREHQAIFDAISSGDPDAAVRAVETHIRTSRTGYEQEVHRVLTGQR